MELKQIYGKSKPRFAMLLIVPYGIETARKDAVDFVLNAFNRTIWN